MWKCHRDDWRGMICFRYAEISGCLALRNGDRIMVSVIF